MELIDRLSVIGSRHGSRAGSKISLSLKKTNDPSRIPPPPHRHAAPSAPWPWIDIGDEVDQVQLNATGPAIPDLCEHQDCECWTGYPQSRFPNWTPAQVKKSGIWEVIHPPPAQFEDPHREPNECRIYRCDVDDKGHFSNVDPLVAIEGQEAAAWHAILDTKRPTNLRVRALFVENMSSPVLRMLGAKFNIEPFFFSSSIKWIPSRFQEEIQSGIGDHITITLPFIKSIPESEFLMQKMLYYPSNVSVASKHGTLLGSQKIDTQAPLTLYSNSRILHLDLISVHLMRNINGSTIISYHPSLNLPTTSAKYLHERIRFAGQSVYWQSMFQRSPDPTLVLMCFVWHALYAWDEALGSLYEHIIALEDRVIQTAHMPLTRELHVIRAHHLHYSSLLDNFIKSIDFIEATPNPFMTEARFSQELVEENKTLLKRECKNLQDEVKRLKLELHMQERRLKNVINLVFSSVNIEDSKCMREMTEAAVRDSAAMKQIAYLTMVFLPASFVAGVFGMNVTEISTDGSAHVATYIAVAIPLTIFSAWVIVAFQARYIFGSEHVSFWRRLTWPFVLLYQRFFQKDRKRLEEEKKMRELEEYGMQTHEQPDDEYKFDVVGVQSQDGDNQSITSRRSRFN